MKSRLLLRNSTFWNVAVEIPETKCETLLLAAAAIDAWLGKTTQNHASPIACLSKRMWGIDWKPSPFLWRKLRFHHVEFSTVFIDPCSFPFETAIHEIAHIIDNSLGSHRLASIFGGGPADELARYLGTEPELFFPRFHAPGFEKILREQGVELNPTEYGRSNGPAEDFAESFRLAVLEPQVLASCAPLRFKWFELWKTNLWMLIDNM